MTKMGFFRQHLVKMSLTHWSYIYVFYVKETERFMQLCAQKRGSVNCNVLFSYQQVYIKNNVNLLECVYNMIIIAQIIIITITYFIDNIIIMKHPPADEKIVGGAKCEIVTHTVHWEHLFLVPLLGKRFLSKRGQSQPPLTKCGLASFRYL